ncbi:putative pre-mRNA-splicing factor SF2-like [Capsicum annuum]|uniref:universal stress protein PHOS34 n=1 Tax=Capsicum annuum TaxID=4072 RepID=UPI001FB06AD2|nr:universal stress protein PHOS34 [Capsicum annuum]KAF3622436.1 putative pre-mRNA-splicing factor SF2-like [Capsicum annuum]KAF3633471.1 putative pre-mRNA-splicing factor SF2-like [Capsicum annuum]
MAEEKSVMVVGIEDNQHSFYALEWTLDHFFKNYNYNSNNNNNNNSLFKLVLVHAKPTPASIIGLAAGPGNVEVFSAIESDLKKIAARVTEKAMEICHAKSVNDVVVEVVEGDARQVLCDVVEKLHASILVVGCHGYGVIKRTVLGSVSDYCAHHAHCSVMIVKKPKIKA